MSGQTARTGPHPRDFDYSHPKLECDVIMKGGITSGVVYPWAVCELAKTYNFKCVGGASAGAIAAAATAAAEYGRDKGGFTVLADLPEWLGAPSTHGGSNLFSLFQPQDSTRRVYRSVMAGLGHTGASRWIGWGFAIVTRFWFSAMLGALLGAFIVWLSLNLAGPLAWVGAILGVVLLVAGAVVGGVVGLALRALSVLPANGFGLCRGFSAGAGEDDTQLTSWLDRKINEAAGLEEGPLTFGMLWEGPLGTGSAEDRVISLEVMTTDLTEGAPAQIPWEGSRFFFDPQEMRAYFPEPVVKWMEDHPPDLDLSEVRNYGLEYKQMLPLLPMPDPENLPVLIAARMSLSFPVLISAVPLYEIDRTRKANQEAKKKLRAWVKAHPASDDETYLASVTTRYLKTKHWFSDGGLCSNFPVHLFDAPLPNRPTFALNLRGFHPENPRPETEAEKVYLPKDNHGGFRSWHYEIAEGDRGALGAFVSAMLGTVRNWQDNSLVPLAGYRDRIAHVSLSDDEGGMNLNMGKAKIEVLAERGRLAAVALAEQFAGDDPGQVATWGWTNHRWTRYRVALAEIQQWLSKYTVRFDAPGTADTPAYRQVTLPGVMPGSHGFEWPDGIEALASKATMDLVDFIGHWPTPEVDLTTGAPRTRPVMRLVWRANKRT